MLQLIGDEEDIINTAGTRIANALVKVHDTPILISEEEIEGYIISKLVIFLEILKLVP